MPPTISSVEASGTTLTITLSEAVYAATAPDVSDFSISGVTLSNLTGLPSTKAAADTSFTLTLSAALSGSNTLSYTQNSSDSKRIKDTAGNALATASSSFSSMGRPTGLDLAATDDTGVSKR